MFLSWQGVPRVLFRINRIQAHEYYVRSERFNWAELWAINISSYCFTGLVISNELIKIAPVIFH